LPASIQVLGTWRLKTQIISESSHHAVPATIDAQSGLRLHFFR